MADSPQGPIFQLPYACFGPLDQEPKPYCMTASTRLSNCNVSLPAVHWLPCRIPLGPSKGVKGTGANRGFLMDLRSLAW